MRMHDRAYHPSMDIEWDPEKAASNLLKHGVDFADAATALWDEEALTRSDPDAQGEERFVSLGMHGCSGSGVAHRVQLSRRQGAAHLITKDQPS